MPPKKYSKKTIRQDYRSKLQQERQEALNVSGLTGKRQEGLLAPFYKQGKYRLKLGGQGTPTSPLTPKYDSKTNPPPPIPPRPLDIITKSFKSDVSGKDRVVQTGESETQGKGHTSAESLKKAADIQQKEVDKQRGYDDTKSKTMSKEESERNIKYFNVRKGRKGKEGKPKLVYVGRVTKEGDKVERGKNVITKYRKSEKEEEQKSVGRKGFRELYAKKKDILKKERDKKLHDFEVRKGERKAERDFPKTRPQK